MKDTQNQSTSGENSILDLEKEYGDKFKIEYDPAAEIDGKKKEYQIIPCKGGKGHFYVFSDKNNLMAFWCESRKLKKTLLRTFSEMTIYTDGDDGICVLIFPRKIFMQVAEMTKAKMRRRLSPEQKARLVEDGEKFRFSTRLNAGFEG